MDPFPPALSSNLFMRADLQTLIVISVAPSPQGELFATGSGDKAARIWRLVHS